MFEIVSVIDAILQCTCFMKLYSTIPTPNIGKFSKVATFKKSILYRLVLKTPTIAIKNHIIHVLSLNYAEIITEQLCKSQILKCFTFLKFLEKNVNFAFF